MIEGKLPRLLKRGRLLCRARQGWDFKPVVCEETLANGLSLWLRLADCFRFFRAILKILSRRENEEWKVKLEASQGVLPGVAG